MITVEAHIFFSHNQNNLHLEPSLLYAEKKYVSTKILILENMIFLTSVIDYSKIIPKSSHFCKIKWSQTGQRK